MTLSSSRGPNGVSYLCSESEGVKQEELTREGEERQTIKALRWPNIWLHSHLILVFCAILESRQSHSPSTFPTLQRWLQIDSLSQQSCLHLAADCYLSPEWQTAEKQAKNKINAFWEHPVNYLSVHRLRRAEISVDWATDFFPAVAS